MLDVDWSESWELLFNSWRSQVYIIKCWEDNKNSRLFVGRERERDVLGVRFPCCAARKTQVGFARRNVSPPIYCILYSFIVRPSLFFSFRPLPFFLFLSFFLFSFFFFLSHNWRMHGENCRTVWLEEEEETLGKMSSAEEALIGESTALLLLLPCVLRDYTMHRASSYEIGALNPPYQTL